MYSMRKFTTLQYTMFMIAALAVLIAVPSAHAATVNVDATCGNIDAGTKLCSDGTTFKTIKDAIAKGALATGDTISISNGTYHNEGGLVLAGNDWTVKPASPSDKVTLTGDSRFDIYGDGVTIRDLFFKNSTWNSNVIYVGLDTTGTTIHNNTFADTRGHAILLQNAVNDLVIRGLSITDNVFKNIGTFYAPGSTLEQKAKALKTALFLVTSRSTAEGGGLQGATITGNTIDTVTFAGINLVNTQNVLVQNNTISNVPAFAIGVGPDGNQIRILDNDIRNANNALEYLNGVREDTTEGAIVLWPVNTSNVTVINNTISGGNNGIVYCTGVCGVHPDQLGDAKYAGHIIDPATKTDSTNKFTHNIFDNVNGFDIINKAFGPMVATHNYYGTPQPTFAARTQGPVYYNPYYNDPERKVLVDDGTGPVQKSIADLDVSPVCSISLGSYIMDFADAKYGATSSIVQNQIKNAGNQDLGGIKFTSTGWQKPDGTALSDAVSRVGTNVADATSYTPITAGMAGINFDNRNFTGSNALPVSGSPGSALVGFVLDLTGVATGADVTITESVTYSATCS